METAYDAFSEIYEYSPFYDVRNILPRELYASIVNFLRVLPVSRFDSFYSADEISSDSIRFLAPLESWVTESSSMFVRPNVKVVIAEPYRKYIGTPEGIKTSFTAEKGNKGENGTKCHTMKTEEGFHICMNEHSSDKTV